MMTKEINNLITKIDDASEDYYAGRPNMSDDEFDALIEELRGYAAQGSPEAKARLAMVGAPAANTAKATHAVPMKSLGNCFDEDAFKLFYERTNASNYDVEPKLDGVAIELVYTHSMLTKVITRGNGHEGEDVTATVGNSARGIPRRLRYAQASQGVVSVHGEMVFPKQDFEEINKERKVAGQPLFANARNAVAGTVRHKHITPRHERMLFAAFKLEPCESETQHEMLEELNLFGFFTPPCTVITTFEEAKNVYQSMVDNRDSLSYEADGIVVKVDRFDERIEIGESEHSPNWAIAWKYASKKAITKIKRIVHELGRTGRITPVAELEPVVLAGAIIKRASLHNYAILSAGDYRSGDVVLVERCGDVIPGIVSNVTMLKPDVVKRTSRVELPSVCPKCGGPTVKEGKFVYCRNTDCGKQLIAAVNFWCGKAVADVDGMGGSLATKLVNEGIITRLSDLYYMGSGELEALSGVGHRTAEKIITKLRSGKADFDLWRFVLGMGIPHVGHTGAVRIAEKFKTLHRLLDASEDEIARVYGIGRGTARKTVETLNAWSDSGEIGAFLAAGLRPTHKEEVKIEGTMTGQVIVFTGKLSQPRAEFINMAKKEGAEVSGSVNKNTTVLVVGEAPGSKYAKARELNVSIITEAEFIRALASV